MLDQHASHDDSAIARLLATCQATLVRVTPDELERVRTAGALVVDIRPVEQRERDGALPGSVVIDHNVLEWRLDPTSPHRLPLVAHVDQRIVLVCNQRFSSSLAAHTLQQLGLSGATDLVGGFSAWAAQRQVQA